MFLKGEIITSYGTLEDRKKGRSSGSGTLKEEPSSKSSKIIPPETKVKGDRDALHVSEQDGSDDAGTSGKDSVLQNDDDNFGGTEAQYGARHTRNGE